MCRYALSRRSTICRGVRGVGVSHADGGDCYIAESMLSATRIEAHGHIPTGFSRRVSGRDIEDELKLDFRAPNSAAMVRFRFPLPLAQCLTQRCVDER